VQQVADRLEILKGSLYYYIKTKEDLLFRLVEEVHDEVDEVLAGVMEEEGLSPLERLRVYAERQVEYNAHNLVRISIYYHDIDQLSDSRRQQVDRRRRSHEREIVGLIEEAQADGDAATDLDAKVLSNCLFATIIWIYRWYRPRGPVSAAELARTCARFAIAGIVGDESPTAGKRG
jgi:AcrR family transcriptional regulator